MKLYKKYFYFLLIFFLIPFGASASNCYDVSNAGTAGTLGTYTDTNTTNNGEPVYSNGTYYLYNYNGGPTHYYVFSLAVNTTSSGVNLYYYQLAGTTGDITRAGVAYDVDTGTAPGPIVALTTCPAPPITSTTTIPSLTTDASSTFATVMGFPWSDVQDYTDNFVKLIGVEIGVVSAGSHWVIAIMFILACVMLIFSAFRFIFL